MSGRLNCATVSALQPAVLLMAYSIRLWYSTLLLTWSLQWWPRCCSGSQPSRFTSSHPVFRATGAQAELSRNRVRAKRIDIWQQAVDTEIFNPRFRSQAMRARMTDGHPEGCILTYIGRLGAGAGPPLPPHKPSYDSYAYDSHGSFHVQPVSPLCMWGCRHLAVAHSAKLGPP